MGICAMTEPFAQGPAEKPGSSVLRQGRYGAGLDPAKRDQILDGAHRVILRMGFDAAGMADITREAGVSKGTIYVYFENKDDLFEALMEREKERLFRDITAALNVEGTIRDRLFSYGTTLTRMLCADPVVQAHRVIIGVAARKPEVAERFFQTGPKRGGELLRGFLEDQMAAGFVEFEDAELAALQFIELCLAGLFRQRLMGFLRDAPTEAVIERNVSGAVAVFMAAYGRWDPRPEPAPAGTA